MPELCCCCGNRFHVSDKECSLLIPSITQFCSIDCFLFFISLQKKYIPDRKANYKSPFVLEAFDIWDEVTQRYYRSWYEIYVARCLFFNKIKFEYETRFIFLKKRPYTPDFWLTEYKLYIEVKGFWGMSSKKKFKEALFKHENIFLLPWHLYSEFRRKYKRKNDYFSVVR